MTLRVLDIESTGIDPEVDAVVEIASADLLPDHTITRQKQALICPPIPIPPESSAVHHLVDADVTGCLPFRDVIEEFAGADAYIAHNCAFERSFLAAHLGNASNGQPPTWICTYKCALRVWPAAKSHSNQALRYQLGLLSPFGIERASLVPHRALSDVIVTAAIFVELLKHARWSQLALWSAEPALHTILSFGKYRGKRYDEIAASDPDYLKWIITKSELDEGAKFSSSYWLGQKREAAA